ncbi:MAG: domain S-box protein [Phycisphaerales bacterium]|nr:domain S-box protein [Phycisphaerales bacterium]
MRELVALSALPAVWAGYQPRQIAEGLADALLSTLRLDLVYVRLPRQTKGQEIEVARAAGRPTTTEETRKIGRALAPFLDDGTADSVPSVLIPAGGATVRPVVVRIRGGGEGGVLVVGSQQSGFPSETDRLLLAVGANQAAVVLERQRAEEALRESEARFRFLVQNSSDIVSLFDAQGTIVYQSPSIERLLGQPQGDRIGRNVFRDSIVHPDDLGAKRAFFDAILSRPGAPATAEFRLQRADGSWRDIEAIGQNFLQDQNVAGIVANYRDVTERKQDQTLLDGQKQILELIIQGEPLGDVLTVLCRYIEKLAQGEMLASVLLLDADGVHVRHGAAPSLPESYVRAIDGLAIGPSAGSCGTAAYRREPVYVSDIASDPLWAPYAKLAMSHGLRACWSSPILSSTGVVLGTFATYYRQPRRPTPRDLRTVDIVTRTLAIAIEQSRAEEALRESEERFRTLAKATNDAIWDWDLGTNKVWWNEGVFTLFGYVLEQNETDPAWWLERVHPEDRAAVESFFYEVVHGKDLSWTDEYRFRCDDGSYKDVYDRGHVIRDDDGRALRMIGAMLDITAQKRAQEAVRESEQRWKNLTEALPQFVWTARPDGFMDYGSAQIEQYMGCAESDLLGGAWLAMLHPDDRDRTQQAWQAAIEAHQNEYEIEHRFRRYDGAYRWFKTRGVAVPDSQGNGYKWFGTCTDITTDKRLEEELLRAKEAAEAANRAKDEFLANVSHEIRTPMNAILGMTELVLDTPLADDQRQSLKTVKSAADNLLGIINDLLDFSKIEAGKLELDAGDFSLRAAVCDTLRALAVRAHRKGLELVCNVQQDVPDALIGDAGRLRQVLLNLVGNAIKFTERGEIVVRVDAPESVPGEDISIRFNVCDTGIGIPPEKRSTIFRAFEQEDTSTTRKYGGTGLGLTISAQLVALMGGSIEVESQVGRGSTFSFTARYGRQAHQPPADAHAPPVLLRNLRVLVVDDNAVNRHILEQWLREWQMEPTSVGDGMVAMDALWHGVAVGKPHALLLLDARMPDTDGLTLAAKIRERAELSGSRIILLTSGDRPGNPARLRELRVDAQLLKPVQRDELLEAIYSIMSGTSSGSAVAAPLGPSPDPAPVAPPAIAPLRVLVAEDSEFNAELMEKLLVKRGHSVRVVSNGRQASTLADADDFDLLFLDLHMPEMDGFEVIRSIREREQATGRHLPVIALTARSRKEDREHCLTAGMDGFLAKPIQTEDLWATIDRVMGGAVAPAPSDRPTPASPRLVDPRVLLAACGGDAVILKSICDTLRARLPNYLAAVQEAFLDQDAPRLRGAAHKMFGMVAAFSTTAGTLVSDLENRAASGQLQEAATLIEQLDTIARQLPRVVDHLSIESLRREADNGDDRNGS